MKPLLIFAVALSVAIHAHGAPGEYASFTSPSGRVIAKAGIAGAEASPSVRLRVRLVFETPAKQEITEIWTGLCHRWAVIWSSDDVFLACGINEETDGNPMEFYAFDFTIGKKEPRRAPTSTERMKVLQEYQKKYPEGTTVPNQTLEPTPGTVTPRADARVAPVPVVAHL